MARIIGALAAEHLAAGLVENGRVGPLSLYPASQGPPDALQAMPAAEIAERLAALVRNTGAAANACAIGVGLPGIVRHGIVEDSPNLQQIKGANFEALLASALVENGAPLPVRVYNDADVMAAGIAATQGYLDKFIRVWTLGNGTGFGRYPWAEGVWEGGHTTVTLDPKENFCGCGGRGHLEGICGHRAMRLRFLDLEPEEVFANARAADARCAEFVTLWHRALAAATATSIHLDGPGKFFISGPNARFLDLGLLDRLVHEMVKMSPLQGSHFEVISTSDEIGVIGAAVNAEQATSS